MSTYEELKKKAKKKWKSTVDQFTDHTSNAFNPSGLIEEVFPIIGESLAFANSQSAENVKNSEESGDQLSPKRGTNVGIPVIYGTRMTGGILIYQEVMSDGPINADQPQTEGDYVNLFQCWALAEGEVQGLKVYVDDFELGTTGNGASNYWRARPNPASPTGGTFAFGQEYFDKLIWTNGYSGDSGSWASGTSYGSDDGIEQPDYMSGHARASGPNWGDHRMQGIACEQITFRHHWDFGPGHPEDAMGPTEYSTEDSQRPDIWKGGMPKLRFQVIGKVIKDSSDVTKVNDDPAWILYDYLINERYGCSIPVDEIDTTSFATASDICADNGVGGRKHSCNIILDTKKPLLTNIKRILATCNGRLHWINGKYTIKIDTVYAGSGEFNFLEKHIIGGIKIVGDSKGERLNQVTAKFINPAKEWKSDEVRYPDKNKTTPINEKAVYDDFLSADNDIEMSRTLNVGGVTDYNEARYLAKQTCLRSRDSLKVSFTSTAEAMNVIVGDVVTVTHSTPGWTAKEFIVRSISLNADGSCSLSCIEHNDAIYAWETAGIPEEAPNTNLPDITIVVAPTGLTVTPASYQSIASAGTRLSVQLEWESTDAFLESHDVDYKKDPQYTTSIWTRAGSTNGRSMLIQDFATGTFDFRVRARNSVGATSSWHSVSGEEITGAILATPEDVSNFEVNIASASANTVEVTWDEPSDPDIKAGGHIEIRNLMEGATQWEEAVPLATVSGTTTSALLPLTEGNYVAKWISSEGIEAVNYNESGLGTVFWTNTVETIQYNDTYAGDKTNLYVADNDGTKILKFVSEGYMDDFPEIDSIITWDEYGGSATEGVYTADAHDMEQVLQMRLYTKKVFTSGVSDGSNYMDTWGKVDSRESWDDIPRLAGVTSYIRTTLDDPANPAALWTGWKQFQIADINARGIQLKITFSSDQEGAEQFRMTELKLLIDMIAKVIGENDKDSTSITYLETFYERPTLVVTPKDMATGDYMTLSSESKTGFNVNFFNASDGAITRNYNYLAKGIG